MKIKRLAFPAMVAVIGASMLLGFTGTGSFSSIFGQSVASAQDDDDGPYAAYREALAEVKKDYYGSNIDDKKSRDLTFAAIRGMLFSLNDPFTSFLDPDEWQAMQQQTRGDFEGIGAVLEAIGQDVKIKNPIPNTPAYKAGLKSGDIIMSVGTHDPVSGKLVKTTSTLGKDINEVVKLIKGPKGTLVSITVMRKAAPKPLTVVVKRAHIEPPIVMHSMVDPQNKIGRIILTEFNDKSDEQFDSALTDLQRQGMRALVFDLRYNPGGLLNVAVDIGSRFIDSGPVVIIQEKNGQRQELRVRPSQRRKHFPLVVLINDNSASASEIVAGAIKDNSAGTLVGEHTFGKGLVQTLYPLNDGSALRLTTAKYFTPKGNDINNKYDDEHRPIFGTGGIQPDVKVEQSKNWQDQDWEDTKNDTQLSHAIEFLRTKLAANTASR